MDSGLANRVALLERQLDEFRRAIAEEAREREVDAAVKRELRERKRTRRRRLRDVAALLGGVGGIVMVVEPILRIFG